jgi:hypothetical protein
MIVTVEADIAPGLRLIADVRKQLPFAVSKAINDTLLQAQVAERERIAGAFTLRRPDFIFRTVKIEREDFAQKDKLYGIMRIDPTRDFLAKFEAGGQKTPRSGHDIAVPDQARPSKGALIPAGLRPKALSLQRTGGRIRGAKRTFVIETSTHPGIYQRVGTERRGAFRRIGRGRDPNVRLLYSFKPSVRIDRRLGFAETAKRVVDQQFKANFAASFDLAMRTAR